MEQRPDGGEVDKVEAEVDWDEPTEAYPRYRTRQALIKAIAIVLIIGLMLAFPLGYLLDVAIQNGRSEAVIAIAEATFIVVLIAVVRSSRKRL